MSDSLWRSLLRNNFRTLDTLASFLQWDSALLHRALASPHFSINIPRRLARKCAKNTLDDPIVRQFIPLQEELMLKEGFHKEPVLDRTFSTTGSLLQKYSGRALLVSTGVCAMHCRYCFRQNYDYTTKTAHFENEIKNLKENNKINEIILSGGDPLSLSTRELSELLGVLNDIPHLDIIRFHTRFPIGIPERITAELLTLLSQQKKQIIFVIHSNHAVELDDDVLTALKSVQKLGIPVLNQSVLLRGVNDSIESLVALSQKLINNGIIPYYLHQLDRVEGSAHFEVPIHTGLALVNELQTLLPGYAVPNYVQEIPGKCSKTHIV